VFDKLVEVLVFGTGSAASSGWHRGARNARPRYAIARNDWIKGALSRHLGGCPYG
jgi:hypothetical protein